MFKLEKDSYGDYTVKSCVKIASIIIIIVMTFILFCMSFKIINAGEVGIKTRFGKIIGNQLNEGLSYKIPIIEKITKITVKVKKFEVDGTSASKDLQDVVINVAVNYKVLPNKATNIFRNVGTSYEETILAPAIQESVKAISALYTAQELITERQEVSTKMQEKLENKVEKYGLSIDNFNIINFNFSAAFNTAIEEKQVAEQKVATAQNALLKAKIEAEQKIVEAEASAKANQLMQQSLTEGILTQRFIEKWNGILPVVNGTGNNILDISNFVK